MRPPELLFFQAKTGCIAAAVTVAETEACLVDTNPPTGSPTNSPTTSSPTTEPTTTAPTTTEPTPAPSLAPTTTEPTTTEPTTTNPTANPTANPSSPPTDRKNVVLFMPDDLHFLYDERPATPNANTNLWTSERVPNMNTVRAEGVVFLEAYVAGPKCAPARFNILTGRYCSRGVYARAHAAGQGSDRTQVEVPQCKISGADRERTLQHVLQSNDWATIQAGKWHLNPSTGAGSVWDDYPGTVAGVASTGFTQPAAVYESNMMDGDTSLGFSHNHEWLTAEANAAMEAAVDAEESFFLYFTPTAPHSPNVYDSLTAFADTATPNGTVSTLDSGFALTRAEMIAAVSGITNRRRRDTKVAEIVCDQALGSLMAKMRQLGVLDSTLIVVTMDHGQAAKDTLFQGGTRVSMMARLPGVIQAGSTYAPPVTNLDFVPSILEFAGIATAPYDLDGQSWFGMVDQTATGVQPAARDCIVSEIEIDRAVVCPGIGMKLISKLSAVAGDADYPFSDDVTQLYDLGSDPTEQVNVEGDPAYAAIRATLVGYIDCHQSDTARVGEVPCVPTLYPPTPSPTPSPVTSAPTQSPSPSLPTSAPTGCAELAYCRGVRKYWGTEQP